MSVSIQNVPSGDYSKATPVINKNFQNIKGVFRTNVIKDNTGTPRVIFGELPDGTYGLVISKEGTSVYDLF